VSESLGFANVPSNRLRIATCAIGGANEAIQSSDAPRGQAVGKTFDAGV
jgi:hypothetical protein